MRWSTALFGAALGAFITPVPSAAAWCQMTTSVRRPTAAAPCVMAEAGEFPLAWRRRCTETSLSIFAARDLEDAAVRGVVQDAIDTWTTVGCDASGTPTGLSVALLDAPSECSQAVHHASGRNVSSIVFVADGWSTERMHDPRAYALTLVWHDPRSGEIWDADMDVNEARGTYAVCPPEGCAPGFVDLPNVLTHEMGHYFGLGHTPDDALATMWSSAEPAETLKRDLQPDDAAGLCALYPPGSLPETCDPTPRGGLGLDCGPGSDCGCSVPGRRAPYATGLGGAALALLGLTLRRRRRSGR